MLTYIIVWANVSKQGFVFYRKIGTVFRNLKMAYMKLMAPMCIFSCADTGIPTYFIYRWLVPKSKRHSCVAGAAIGTSAGNSIATPAAIAAIDPSWLPFAEVATAQVAASIVVTAITIPILVDWLYKREQKKGLLNYDVPIAADTEETAEAEAAAAV